MESGERLTIMQVAALLDVEPRTVRRLIAARRFPPGWSQGRAKYWWAKDVESYLWLASRGAFGADLPAEKGRKRDTEAP